jgi:formate dehydrogenase major subunit
MLIRKSDHRRGSAKPAQADRPGGGLDRRTFLKRSGIVAGTLAALGDLALNGVRKVDAGAPPPPGAPVSTRKNICTHCSVGCSVIAKVSNGV